MTQIPKDDSFDNTLMLLSEGYKFISNRCQKLQTDVFETRLMLQKVFCCYGEEAARIFYEGDRFTRKMAIPPTTLLLLQGPGSVATLDGEAHQLRKRMFLSILNPEATKELAHTFITEWRAQIPRWEKQKEVVLHDEIEQILCRAVCKWAGVYLPEKDVIQRSREFAAMIDGAGSAGPRNWWGLVLRKKTESWITEFITDLRNGKTQVPLQSPAAQIAFFKDQNQNLLNPQTAAIELINILRPTVAIARFITFAALALHENPECREKLRYVEDGAVDNFAQEVRRYYPFFPAVGGRVKNEFHWKGHHFTKGTWVMLDLYGTNHDPRIWKDPHVFRPERFHEVQVNPFNLIPQGGGEHSKGHRCAGEGPTNEILRRAIRFLCQEIAYQVPRQDLSINLSRMPAIPKSHFVIQEVRELSAFQRTIPSIRSIKTPHADQSRLT